MPTSTYQVVGKAHIRATTVEQAVVDAHGNTVHIRHAGDACVHEKGTLLTDVTPEELRAFPDRFVLVAGDGYVPPVSSPTPRRVNPDLYQLVQRAHAGEATHDEQTLVAPVLAFLAAAARGEDTSAAEQALTASLIEWDMPLFME